MARFDDTDALDLASIGQTIQAHRAFPNGVNVGAMQVLSPKEINLRVFERGVGETLACGTGACAAVVAGVVQGWLEGEVTVHTRGGDLRIHWSDSEQTPVMMSGPALKVFDATVDIPALL